MTRFAMVMDVADDALERGIDVGKAFDAIVPQLHVTCEVPPPLVEGLPAAAEQARELLVAGAAPEFLGQPLPTRVMLVQGLTADSLLGDVEDQGDDGDRLYVLEFQGARQYVMFGHTTNLKVRLAEHMRAATPHGYALLNGWASPPLLPDARQAEWALLLAGGHIHTHMHYRERFYDMPYERGLNLARCVFQDFSERDIVESVSQQGRRPPGARRSCRGLKAEVVS